MEQYDPPPWWMWLVMPFAWGLFMLLRVLATYLRFGHTHWPF